MLIEKLGVTPDRIWEQGVVPYTGQGGQVGDEIQPRPHVYVPGDPLASDLKVTVEERRRGEFVPSLEQSTLLDALGTLSVASVHEGTRDSLGKLRDVLSKSAKPNTPGDLTVGLTGSTVNAIGNLLADYVDINTSSCSSMEDFWSLPQLKRLRLMSAWTMSHTISRTLGDMGASLGSTVSGMNIFEQNGYILPVDLSFAEFANGQRDRSMGRQQRGYQAIESRDGSIVPELFMLGGLVMQVCAQEVIRRLRRKK